MYSFLLLSNPHQKYVYITRVYMCTYPNPPFRSELPPPHSLLPGVKGKIPGTQAFVTVSCFNEG